MSHSEHLYKGLMVAKCLVTCSIDHLVSLRISNPGHEIVYLNKGMILATFQLCDNSVDLTPVKNLSCANIQRPTEPVLSSNSNSCTSKCQASSEFKAHLM